MPMPKGVYVMLKYLRCICYVKIPPQNIQSKSHILNSETLKAFQLKSEKEQICLLTPSILNIVLWVLVNATEQEKKW